MMGLSGIRFPLAILAVVASLVSTAICADPNVIGASHEVDADNVADEKLSAVDDALSYSPRWPDPPNTGAMLMRLGFGTVVVIALCIGSLWFGKPWLQRLQLKATTGSAMTIEGSVALGNRAMLYLVRVGDARLVAGTDLGGLKSLVAIPASFKDVLDEQLPEIQAVEISTDRLPEPKE